VEDAHDNLREVVKVIDKCIHSNANPELTCVLALRLYRIVLKAHSKLGSRKEHVKERLELT
jgi:hypothetical protein